MENIPTKIAFERRYSDDSGVEFGVSFDASKSREELQFDCVNKVCFPVSELDWIIDCLVYIRSQVDPA